MDILASRNQAISGIVIFENLPSSVFLLIEVIARKPKPLNIVYEVSFFFLRTREEKPLRVKKD